MIRSAGRAAPPGRSIALVHYAAPPVVGGVERVLARQAVLMADAGHEVAIVAGRGEAPDPRIRFVEIPLLDPRDPTVDRLQRALDAGRIPEDFGEVVATISALLEAVLAGVDIVVAHNVCSLNLNLALTAALRRLSDHPGSPEMILWHHDLAWASPAYRPTLHPGPPWDLLREAWPGAIQVAVSEGRRADLAGLIGVPPESIAVVPNGIDLATMLRLTPETTKVLERTHLLEADPVLLLPSRITARKNIELALRVVAAMREAGSRAGLVVTGPVDPHQASGTGYFEQLRTLRATLGLDRAAWFLSDVVEGPPSDAVVDDLYRLADGLILPSRDEGFGLPILEAAVNRLPIVCTDLPALRELAGDAALYIGPDEDPAGIARRVLERIAADRTGRLAHEVRARYAWEAVYREGIAPLLARA